MIESDNGDDARRALEADRTIRLAIVDWNLPGLSGRTSEEEQVLALDGGADDSIAKPTKPSLLRARIGVGRRIVETLLIPSEGGANKPHLLRPDNAKRTRTGRRATHHPATPDHAP